MSISLTTRAGTGSKATFYVGRNVTGTLTVEFGDTGHFNNIVLTKTVTPVGTQVDLSLTATEVDAIKDSEFRVKDSNGVIVEKGSIGYIPAPPKTGVNADDLVSDPTFSAAYVPLAGAGTSDDTVRLNALLTAARNAGGGLVKGTPGQTYTLKSGPLVIGSHTVLDMTGCTIVLDPASTESTMLIDTGHNAMLYAGGTWAAPQDIIVLGGYWNDQGVGGLTFNGRHKFILGGDRITVRGQTFHSTSGKYAICLQNITNFTVEGVVMDTVDSDGVHIQGPAFRGTVRNIKGTSRDDLISITPVDWSQYTWGNEGDVSDILIENIQGIDCLTNIVKVLSGSKNGTPVNTRRIIVRNVTGNLTTGANYKGVPISGVYVGDDGAQGNTSGGQIHDVLVDGVSIKTLDMIPIIFQPSTTVPIKSLVIRNVYVQSDCTAVVKIDGGNVDSLTVDGVSGGTTTAPIADGLIWLAQGRIGRLRLSNVDFTNAGPTDGALVKSATASNVLVDLAVLNARTSALSQGFDLSNTTSVHLVNIKMVGNSMFCFLRPTAIVTLDGSGFSLDNTSSIAASGAQIIPRSFDIPLDVDAMPLVATAGNRLFNTSAGVAGGIGPAMFTGTSWQRVV